MYVYGGLKDAPATQTCVRRWRDDGLPYADKGFCVSLRWLIGLLGKATVRMIRDLCFLLLTSR